MNYCELIRKIAANPFTMMSVHLGRDMVVRDMYEIKAHVDSCIGCQEIMDKLNEKYPIPEGFHQGDLN